MELTNKWAVVENNVITNFVMAPDSIAEKRGYFLIDETNLDSCQVGQPYVSPMTEEEVLIAKVTASAVQQICDIIEEAMLDEF